MRAYLLLSAAVIACSPGQPEPDAGPMCPAPTGAGTMHTSGSVNADTTWAAAESPHVVISDLSIYKALTLEPCAVVAVSAGKTVTVNAGGSLLANGTATQPVTIKKVDGGANWAQIRFIGGTGRLTHTVLENGGNPLNTIIDLQGVLDIRSGQALPTGPDPVVFVDHVTIRGSASNGIRMQSAGAFTADSTALTITGSAGHAASISAPLVSSLPPGTYTGNTLDDVLLTDEAVRWDITLHDRGVPYLSGAAMQTGVTSIAAVGAGPAVAVLTVEPGVVWKFKKDTGLLNVDMAGTPSRAVLIAKGTAAKPITFTSAAANPAAGDWLGIWIGADDPRNSLDHVKILFAGRLQAGSGSNSCQSLLMSTTASGGALRVYHVPPVTLVTNTEFADSATHAIDRGWRSDVMPSLLAGNTFTRINLCNESMPRDMNGACPMPPPCPK